MVDNQSYTKNTPGNLSTRIEKILRGCLLFFEIIILSFFQGCLTGKDIVPVFIIRE